MACADKTVKINGTFEVWEPPSYVSNKAVLKDLSTIVQQVAAFGPWEVPGTTIDQQISFGGITLAKRLYLKTDQSVTLKFNQSTDIGFSFKGEGVLSSEDGITALFVTTGPNDTCVTAIICGD